MSILNFDDGVSIDTSGKLRPLLIPNDGWYVVGEGMLFPVNDWDEAMSFIKDLEKRKQNSS